MIAMRFLAALCLIAALCAPAADAKGTHGGKHGKGKSGHSANWSPYAKRAKNDRIARSSSARQAFLKSQGYANGKTPQGMIVDHIVPLAAGGKDTPSNMRLITKAQEIAQHAAEMASARNPKGYNPNAQSHGGAKAKASKHAAPKHHHKRHA